MRIDYDFLGTVLGVFLDAPGLTVSSSDFDDIFSTEEAQRRLVFHLEILGDEGLLEAPLATKSRLGITYGPTGGHMIADTPWRLTAAGHNFAASLAKPDFASLVQERAHDEGLAFVIELGKKFIEKQAERLLGDL
ncbi:MAG: hypothetical protein NXI30_04715 [bacterium]|nr:hypothetical protein [bacterium]